MEIINGVLTKVTNEDIINGEFIFPEGVTSIGDNAFEKCKSLINIDIPEGVTSIGDSAFFSCNYMTDINIPESVTSIGVNAFGRCKSLTSIDISKGVKSIELFAFHRCTFLTSISISESLQSIAEDAIDNCNALEKLITPWGEIELMGNDTKYIIQNYLYLYANHLLKDRYSDLDDFLSNQDIYDLFDSSIMFQKGSISKFKNLFYKMRKQYDIPPKLLSYLKLETTEEFDLKVWNQIKNIFEWKNSEEMTKAFAEMIEVFGLFHKDSKQKERIKNFQELVSDNPYRITSEQYFNLADKFDDYEIDQVRKSFQKIELLSFQLKRDIRIPIEFKIYLGNELTEEEIRRIRKITGTYGKQLNDFVKESYIESCEEKYELLDGSAYSDRIKSLFFTNNYYILHTMFDGCNELYDEDFYEFFIENLSFILNDEKLQSDLKNIQKHFKSMKNYYLHQAGIEKIALKQAVDYINSVSFDYHKGNYELVSDVKKAGVTEQESFDYYQKVYEKNDIRRLYSLVRRSNTYEINGYTIKVELLRKDDSFGMLVGEKNYTNCCQVFGGAGHNCMAHAVSSSDGGIFVTRLLKDGEWILLTESWDWQNNNLYCHDNIEGTSYFKNGPSSLKEAVAKAIQLDGEYIIEESKNSVEKYIESRRKILEKSISSEKEKELEKLRELEQREVIKLVTCGTEYDDLGVSHYFKSSIRVNQGQVINGERFTLSNFQPVNYNSSQVYFDTNHSAYSDAKNTQVIIAGSIEELCLSKLEPLVPIYRDERRLVLEEKDSIRDYTIRKISNIENKVYPEVMRNYGYSSRGDFSDNHIYLGEDWYLIYEEREDNSIYVSDLARVEPELEDEKEKQNQEMMEVIYELVQKYDSIEADLKEDTSYLLYLMNKKLGYFEQIGEDISYPFEDSSNTRVITEEEQKSILKKLREIRKEKNPELIMHKLRFKKGRLLSNNIDNKKR